MTARRPDRLKVIAGTARPDRVEPGSPGLSPVDAAPNPPSWLKSVEGLAEWRRLVPILMNNGLLTDGNLSVLGHLCALHGRLASLWETGTTPPAATIAIYKSLSASLGLLSFKHTAPPPRPNKFSNNAARQR